MKWFGPCAICLSSAERTNLEKGILLQICKAYLHQSAFTHKHITCAKNSKEEQKQNISWSRRRSLGHAWRCLKNDCGSVHAAQLEISSAKLQKNGRCGGTPTSGQLKPLRVATLGAAAAQHTSILWLYSPANVCLSSIRVFVYLNLPTLLRMLRRLILLSRHAAFLRTSRHPT